MFNTLINDANCETFLSSEKSKKKIAAIIVSNAIYCISFVFSDINMYGTV